MKKTLITLIIAMAATAAANAISILTPFGTDIFDTYYINKKGTGIGGSNGNNPDNNLFRLNEYFLAGPDLTPTAHFKIEGGTGYDWSSGGLGGYNYAVLHYGASAHGGNGGTIGAYEIDGTDAYVFPQDGWSSIDLFRFTPVPDSGSTLALLGAALLGLIGLRSRKN